MFCPECGMQLPDGSRFCGVCGCRLLPAEAATEPVAVESSQKSEKTAEPAGNLGTVRKPEESREEAEKNPAVPAASGGPEKPGGKKKLIIAAATAAIAVIICIIAAAVLLISDSKETGSGDVAGSAETVSGSAWQEQYDLGVRYLEELDYEAAIVAFTEAIAIDPKQTEAYLGRAEAYLAAGDTEDCLSAALTDYQTVLELDADQIDVYIAIGNIYIATEDYDAAVEAYTGAIDGGSQNPAAWSGRADAYLAADDTEESREAALADYQTAVELDENQPDIWQKIAEISMRRGEYEEAAEAFTRAIETGAEDNAVAYAGRAEAYLAAGDTEENRTAALADLLTLLALQEPGVEPEPDLYALITELLLEQEGYEQALELLTEALDAGAEEAFLYTLRGSAWQAMAEAEPEQADTCLAAALADYEAAAELDGESADAWAGIAAVYTAQGRASEAITLLNQILTTGLWDTALYLARGDAYLTLEQTQENLAAAFENYRTVTILSPELEEGYLKAAEVCVLQGDAEGAQSLLEDGTASAETTDTITLMLAEIGTAEESATVSQASEDSETVQEIREKYLANLVQAAELLSADLTAHRPFLYTDYTDVLVDVGWLEGFELLEDGLREIMGSLSEAIFIELDNGYYLGVYKKGIYYGELSGGVRSGSGLWFSTAETKGGYAISAYLGDWAEDLPNGEGLYTGSCGESILSIEFVDGVAEGEGTYYSNSTYSSEGTYSCSIIAEDGYLAPQYLYDGIRYAALFTSSSGSVTAVTSSDIGRISLKYL